MADIELVIKIDEKYLEGIKECVKAGEIDYEPWVAIANGTPLPKGHGNLIDENELIDGIVCEEIDGKYYDVVYANCIYDAATIIEAESEDRG